MSDTRPDVRERERADEHRRGESDDSRRVLLVIIASDPGLLDDLITALLDLGLTGATVLESRGLSAILRQDMPIFAGLAALLPERTGSRVVLSATTRRSADAFLEYLEGELETSVKPIAFTVPIDAIFGVRE